MKALGHYYTAKHYELYNSHNTKSTENSMPSTLTLIFNCCLLQVSYRHISDSWVRELASIHTLTTANFSTRTYLRLLKGIPSFDTTLFVPVKGCACLADASIVNYSAPQCVSLERPHFLQLLFWTTWDIPEHCHLLCKHIINIVESLQM